MYISKERYSRQRADLKASVYLVTSKICEASTAEVERAESGGKSLGEKGGRLCRTR
jgi:hypothetical protein